MATFSGWYSRPVFISSTFKDMGAERDYLRNFVFPELEERLRERRHYIEPVDLRWGIETSDLNDEHDKELLILKVCLGEIERSKPFLIALIGDRYGWRPPEDRLERATNEAGYVEPTKNKSITALEIEYGVLNNPSAIKRCYFYIREPLPYSQMSEELASIYSDEYNGDSESALHLSELKKRIINDPRFRNRVRAYNACWDTGLQKVTGLEDFGRMVLDDLWHDLQDETENYKKEIITWQDNEREYLNEFIETHTRSFSGREDILEHIRSFAFCSEAGCKKALLISGTAGSGKSALIAQAYRNLNQDILVLANAAGSGPRSADPDSMIERWIDELCIYLKIDNQLPQQYSTAELDRYFRKLLFSAASQTRVLILVDAINQFEKSNRGLYMLWLPDKWPDNARLVCTGLPSEQCRKLLEKDYAAEISIPPLSEANAREIVINICSRYHRTLNPEVLAAILLKKRDGGEYASSNPLWLKTAVEELNLIDSDTLSRVNTKYKGTAEECLKQLLKDTVHDFPPDPEALISCQHKRAEKLFGEGFTSAFLSLISVSRTGWREKDIEKLIPQATGENWNRLHFSAFRRFLRGHITETGQMGLLVFRHTRMNEAVYKTYLTDEHKKKEIHRLSAQYLLSLSPEELLRTEIMFHLIGSNDPEAIAEYYASDLPDDEIFEANRTLAEFISSGKNDQISDRIDWVLNFRSNRYPFLTKLINSRLSIQLSTHLKYRIGSKDKEHFFTSLKKYFIENQTSFDNDDFYNQCLAFTLEKLGEAFIEQARLKEALESCLSSLDILSNLSKDYQVNNSIEYHQVDVKMALGDIYIKMGNLIEAEKMYTGSLEIIERLDQAGQKFSGTNLFLSDCYQKMGVLFEEKGKFVEAQSALGKSLDIIKKQVEKTPDDTDALEKLGLIYETMGNIFSKQMRFTDALITYQESLKVWEQLVRTDPANLYFQEGLAFMHFKVGDNYRVQFNPFTAGEKIKTAIDSMEKIIENDPTNIERIRTLAFFNEILASCAIKPEDACVLLAKAAGLMEGIMADAPDYPKWKKQLVELYPKLGDNYMKLGKTDEARDIYLKSLIIIEKDAGENKWNITLQKDLLIAYWRMAKLEEMAGDTAAEKWWNKGFEMLSNPLIPGHLYMDDKRIQEIMRHRLRHKS